MIKPKQIFIIKNYYKSLVKRVRWAKVLKGKTP